MKFLDLLMMSANNLFRRKMRTFLTVLGVIIGTASIVVMISLGIGLNKFTMEQYESSGSLTAIQVYNYSGGRGSASDNTNPEDSFMTDETMKVFAGIPNVVSAHPQLNMYVMMKQGIYEGHVRMVGIPLEAMQDIKLAQGSLPAADADGLEMVVGNMVIQSFSNSKTGAGYWDTGEMPDVNFMNKPVFTIFDMDSYYQSQSRSGGEEGAPAVKAPKKYLLKTAGMVEGGIEDWNTYSNSVYVDLEKLKTQLRQIFKKKPIMGQPTNKKGKPYPYFIYEEAVVNVDEMKNVVEVQKAINSMGYEANSQMEWLEQSQKQSNMVQAVLGGIGAVSLFVAAIGIANTMMMSIYERTKEIGVIKVLGCAMGNIRTMFLIEAGFIGFIGGVVGVALSYIISFLVNKFLAGALMQGMTSKLSMIPPWLALASVGFAILIGMLAGLFPALRAMKLSPLAAIRNE